MIGLAGDVTVKLCVPENGSSYSDLIILCIILQLNSDFFSVIDKAFYYVVEGKAVGVACEPVGAEQERSVGV